MVASDRYDRNFYASADLAEAGAQKALNSRATFYIWQTDEGLFDWSAIPSTLREGDTLVRQGKVR